jgi:hypothetical protein
VADVPSVELVIEPVQGCGSVVQDDPGGLEGRRDILEVKETLIDEPEMLEDPEEPVLQLIELGRHTRRILGAGIGVIVRMDLRRCAGWRGRL